MANLFISYSRRDIEIARRLTGSFSSHQLDFWIDWEGIAPTVDWWLEIEKGIEQADNFLFLISPDSAQSKVCRLEIDHAIKNGKRLIPVLIRDTKGHEVPPELGSLNWIFMREGDDFDAGLERLISAITTDYAWVQYHRRLQVKALEWDRSKQETSLLIRGKDLQDAEMQFGMNGSKQPYPTDLQRQYILASRQASDRQRRLTMGIAITGVIVLAALSIVAVIQAGLATTNAKKEQAASTLAVANANAAEAASTLATFNEREAKRQADVALARQLAANSQLIFTQNASKYQTAVLLAIQSMRISPSSNAASILQNEKLIEPFLTTQLGGPIYTVSVSSDSQYIAAGGCGKSEQEGVCSEGAMILLDANTYQEISRMKYADVVISLSFSPDGRFVISGSYDGTADVWATTSGKKTAHLVTDNIIRKVAFSPDGNYVASAGDDGSVRLWDPITGHLLRSIPHPSQITTVIFSNDGKYLASATDQTVYVWEVATGLPISQIGQVRRVHSMAFSPDGLTLVAGTWNGTKIWYTLSGQEIRTLAARGVENAFSVAYSPDGKYVISGMGVGQIDRTVVWDVSTGEEISEIIFDPSKAFVQGGGSGPALQNSTVAFSPDSRYAVSGGCHSSSADCVIGSVKVWDIQTASEIAQLMYSSEVRSVALSQNGRLLVSGSVDGTIDIWSIESVNAMRSIQHDSGVFRVAISPDSKYVATGGGDADPVARVWDMATGRLISSFKQEVWISDLSFSPDGKYVASISMRNAVWETMTGKEYMSMPFGAQSTLAVFSPDAKYLAFGGCDEWAFETGCTRGMIRILLNETSDYFEIPVEGSITDLVYSHDGTQFATVNCDTADTRSACSEMSITLWDSQTRNRMSTFTTGGRISSIAISPDGQLLLAAGCDSFDYDSPCESSTVHTIDLRTGTDRYSKTQPGDIRTVKFSPDGSFFTAGGSDSALRVWATSTGDEIFQAQFDDEITAIVISPDNKYLAAGSEDRTTRVWDMGDKTEISRTTHGGPVAALAMSPDGRYLVSGGSDKYVQIWLYRPDDLINDACSRLTRNLTRAEWEQYIGNEYPYAAVCPNLSIE